MRKIRSCLRRRGIWHVIPEEVDHKAARLRGGSRGARPPGFDRDRYEERSTVERAIDELEQFTSVAIRYDERGYVLIWHRRRTPHPAPIATGETDPGPTPSRQRDLARPAHAEALRQPSRGPRHFRRHRVRRGDGHRSLPAVLDRRYPPACLEAGWSARCRHGIAASPLKTKLTRRPGSVCHPYSEPS